MTTLPPAAPDTMTLEQARELARELKTRPLLPSVHLLCDLILSDAMTREIENAAYRRCIEIADKAILDGNSSAIRMNRVTVNQIKNDIRSLMHPATPSQDAARKAREAAR